MKNASAVGSAARVEDLRGTSSAAGVRPEEFPSVGDLPATLRIEDRTVQDDPALLPRAELVHPFEETVFFEGEQTEDSRALKAHEILLGIPAEFGGP